MGIGIEDYATSIGLPALIISVRYRTGSPNSDTGLVSALALLFMSVPITRSWTVLTFLHIKSCAKEVAHLVCSGAQKVLVVQQGAAQLSRVQPSLL
jgi:hypothetical protein